MISDYWNGITIEFNKGCAVNIDGDYRSSNGTSPLGLREFLKYAEAKKIKFKQRHIVEILKDESENHNISQKSFIKLMVLASCGGHRTKIGISNFKKLMNHMNISK